MQVEQIGRVFQLTKEYDRVDLVLTLVRAYFLLGVMASNVPEVTGRVPLFSLICRGPLGHEKSRYVVSACWHAELELMHQC